MSNETESELLAVNQQLLDAIAQGDWATYAELCDSSLTAFLNIHTPIIIAMGIVEAIVNVPQELSDNAFTTTRPSPAKATIIIRMMANDVVTPLTLLISALAIAASDNPLCCTDAVSITKS